MLTDALPRLRSDRAQLEALLDRVTINVSQLWRHPDQWAHLERGLLAELAARGPVRAWSAGCSYGAEAYTLAAVCRNAIPRASVRILGPTSTSARSRAPSSASSPRPMHASPRKRP